MNLLLIGVLVISAISLFFNAGYIIHELGWYPHTKDRKNPREQYGALQPPVHSIKMATHDFQVMDGWTYDLRKLGHAEVYGVKDPYAALEQVMSRYKENPTRSRYDDLVHLSNYISNKVQSDEKVNALIDRIEEMIAKETLFMNTSKN